MTKIQPPMPRNLDITDHALVPTFLNISTAQTNRSQILTARKWKKGNHADLLKEVLGCHMEELTCSGINNMWLEWKNKFLNALDEVALTVPFWRRNNCRSPWMTPELLHLMH